MSFIENNNSYLEYSLRLNNSAKEIKAGQYLSRCVSGFIIPSRSVEKSPPTVERYKITDVQKLPHPIEKQPHKQLMVSADYIGDDLSLIPEGAKQWWWDDVIQFAEIKLNKPPASPLN